MSKKASVPNRQYTEEFKVEAMRLAASIGGNAAAKRLGVPQSTVTNGCAAGRPRRQTPPPSRSQCRRLHDARCRSSRRRTRACAESWSTRSWTWIS